MIVARPKTNTVFALTLFTLLLAVGLVTLLSALYAGRLRAAGWWLLAAGLAALVLVLLIRGVITYKIICLQKHTLRVRYRFLGRSQRYDLRELSAYEEVAIKTFQTTYRELRMQFPQGMLRLSEQEYTHYAALRRHIAPYARRGKA